MCILVLQIVFLGLLSDYFINESPTADDIRNAYFNALGLSLLSFLLVFTHTMAFYQAYKLGMLTRILMTSAIYQKVKYCCYCNIIIIII